jgi:hypothetical protein
MWQVISEINLVFNTGFFRPGGLSEMFDFGLYGAMIKQLNKVSR